MIKTDRFGLNKPEEQDFVNVTDLNENMDLIEAELGQVSDHVESESNPHNVTPLQIGAALAMHTHNALTQRVAELEAFCADPDNFVSPALMGLIEQTAADVATLLGVTDAQGGMIDGLVLALNQLEAMVALLRDALFNDITGNPWTVAFGDLDGITLTGGVWHKAQGRLEV